MTDPKATTPRTPPILNDPVRNRGVAFSAEERAELGLTGRLPSAVLTLDEQAERAYIQLRAAPAGIARTLYLEQLHDRNETLYFTVLSGHLAELLPFIADPLAGEAIGQYSPEYRSPGGIYLSIDRPGDIEKSFATLGLGADDVDVIVCSDAAEIPGIGDGGVGGIQIAAGKLAVYTAAAGVRPGRVIPVSLDAGTDNEALRSDPLYLGNRHARRGGREYDAFGVHVADRVDQAHHPARPAQVQPPASDASPRSYAGSAAAPTPAAVQAARALRYSASDHSTASSVGFFTNDSRRVPK